MTELTIALLEAHPIRTVALSDGMNNISKDTDNMA